MLNWQGYQDYMLEMTLSTKDDPKAMVNFGDASTGGSASVSFWIARRTRDGLAQWFGETMAFARDPWSVVYFDTTVHPTPPAGGTHLWKSDLSWLVGRTGYAADDLVVAMRSGPPYNHEHADRNGMILKCFGERLVVDPMRPPYAQRDPSWKMRLTPGHSAALVDGKGHQYVSGADGTNASEAVATIIRHGVREGYMFWTSDATPAYQLVLPDVASITRTMITLTTVPAVIVIDKLIKKETPSTLQARFYAFNTDGKGSASTTEGGFTIVRPYAKLLGQAIAGSGVTVRSAVPDIPAEKAVTYPFVEASTIRPQKESILISLLEPLRSNETGTVNVSQENGVYTVVVNRGGAHATVRIFDTGTVPEFEVR